MRTAVFPVGSRPGRAAGTGGFGVADLLQGQTFPVRIPLDQVTLDGDLTIPAEAEGVVLFAHGGGSGRHSPRNQLVARAIQASGTATLLFDLLTRREEAEDEADDFLRFDIKLLASRLIGVSRWVANHAATRHLGIGYFGASTGGAAALAAAAQLGSEVEAVVSRGGRPDLAGAVLARVTAPTLIIVGARDELVRALNEMAYEQLHCRKRLVVVPRATHLFEEPGALENVATAAAAWFHQHLKPR